MRLCLCSSGGPFSHSRVVGWISELVRRQGVKDWMTWNGWFIRELFASDGRTLMNWFGMWRPNPRWEFDGNRVQTCNCFRDTLKDQRLVWDLWIKELWSKGYSHCLLLPPPLFHLGANRWRVDLFYCPQITRVLPNYFYWLKCCNSLAQELETERNVLFTG